MLAFLTVCSTLLHDLGCTLSKNVLQGPLGLGTRYAVGERTVFGCPLVFKDLQGPKDTIGEMLGCIHAPLGENMFFLRHSVKKVRQWGLSRRSTFLHKFEYLLFLPHDADLMLVLKSMADCMIISASLIIESTCHQ